MLSVKTLSSYNLSTFKNDFTASIVVFLVAIPLCLGIALASGAPLFAGIIAGIIGGIVVGIISESSVSVSGPAAGMVAVVLAAIVELGGFNVFLLALLFAGLLQIIIGCLRAGFIADYIPSNVIQGLLCAIGILIIFKQLPFVFTYSRENTQLLKLLKDISGTIEIHELTNIAHHFNLGAINISILSFLILIYFDYSKHSTIRKIPGSIVVVILGIFINEIFDYIAPNLTQDSTELVNIPVSNNFNAFLAHFQLPSWDSWRNPNVYLYAVILAAVASLEALLNLEGIEKLDKAHHYCSRNRELIAQGVGNMMSGLIGGLPITSVIVRSSVNISAGAQTKVSTILHGGFILLVVLLIPHMINKIPLASLAAILIYVGYKLTKPVIYREMYSQGASRFIPFTVTVIAIIATNLLTGIIIGLLIAFFFILKESSRIQLDIINEIYPTGEVKRLVLPQHMSFLRKASLIAELEAIPGDSRLIVDARATQYIDRDILDVLHVFKTAQAPQKQISINMLGFKDYYEIHDQVEFLNVTTYHTQVALTPHKVLDILKEGNNRFVLDKPINRHIPQDLKAASYTQHPIAIIVGCIDSRVPVESIFDMGFGDVFVSRVAGNVINDDILGSLEFACHTAGAKLIVVLGHTFCGAIKAACDHSDVGYIKHLLDKIRQAIAAETITKHDRTSDNPIFMMNVTKLNVENALKEISSKSNILNRLVKEGEIKLVGATYDIKTGIVNFHD